MTPVCKNPIKQQLKGRDPIMVACRKCDQCRGAKKRHYIGRLNAEAQGADSVTFATFTYGGGDHYRSSWLHYEDLQKCFKILRKRGHRFRYVAVGEYGGEKERAHFHALIFWQGEEPEVVYDQHVFYKGTAPQGKPEQDFWKHGFIQFERPRSKQAAAAYIMDYFKKGADARLKPSVGLGEDYLCKYAEDQAKAGLPLFPKSDRYTVPGNNASNGKAFWYTVGKKTAIYQKMIEAYAAEWHRLRDGQPIVVGEDLREELFERAQNLDRENVWIQYLCGELFGLREHNDYSEGVFIAPGVVVHQDQVIWLENGDIIWRRHLKGAGLVGALNLYHQRLKELGKK